MTKSSKDAVNGEPQRAPRVTNDAADVKPAAGRERVTQSPRAPLADSPAREADRTHEFNSLAQDDLLELAGQLADRGDLQEAAPA